MSSLSCIYPSWTTYFVGLTVYYLPIVASASLWMLSAFAQDPIFFYTGLYLNGAWAAMYTTQQVVGRIDTDPFCSFNYTYAVPNTLVFYTVSFFTAIIAWVATSKRHNIYIGIYSWVLIILVGASGPFILIFYRFHRWQDMLISSLIGVVPTWGFIWFLRHFVEPSIEVLQLGFPWKYFGRRSSYLKGSPESIAIAESYRLRHG